MHDATQSHGETLRRNARTLMLRSYAFEEAGNLDAAATTAQRAVYAWEDAGEWMNARVSQGRVDMLSAQARVAS